jgi:hypothetical protein
MEKWNIISTDFFSTIVGKRDEGNLGSEPFHEHEILNTTNNSSILLLVVLLLVGIHN